MKIEKIKINNFGKIKDKEISFEDKINIVHGENESGKSTVLQFIISSFYGISKNKRGKDFTDFEKYKPWVGDDFSGKIIYSLDNKMRCEVFRDFNKKTPKVFDENLQDITSLFEKDKNAGSQFFYEQTKVEEDMFLSTLVSMQQEVKLEKSAQTSLIQKIANLVSTGDDNISYKKAVTKLDEKLREEVGTDKTQGRPINIVNNRINELEKEKKELEYSKEKEYNINDKISEVEQKIVLEEYKNSILKSLKELDEQNKEEESKIKVLEGQIFENKEKLKDLKDKEKTIQEEIEGKIKQGRSEENQVSRKSKDYIFIIISLVVIGALAYFSLWALILTLPLGVFEFLRVSNKKRKEIIEDNKRKQRQKENDEVLQRRNKIEYEIEIIEKSNIEKQSNINDIKNLINNKKLNNINVLKSKFGNNIYEYEDEINQINKLNSINFELEKSNKNIKELELEKNTLNNNKELILKEVDWLVEIEEELSTLIESKENLEKDKQAINLVKQLLEKAYLEMRNNVTPKFTKNLSNNIQKISNNKYKNVKINDEDGLMVEIESGDYIPAEKLSVGTIEQLYLSLRLAIIDELSEENMPIILDEAFAYFDDERLKETIKYLESQNKQVMIFTCTNRETKILNELNLKYNLVEM